MRDVILITGASRGIGRAVAVKLASRGLALALGCHTALAETEALAAELRETYGVDAAAFAADVADGGQVDAMFAAAEKRLGPVTGLVNNAGIASQKLFTDTTPEEWNAMMGVHAGGTYYTCRRALPSMIRSRRGSIVNLSSIWGLTGASCEVAYSAAKAAVIGLTRALAKEVGPSGIRVNCIAPGVIDTEMNGNLTPEVMAQLREETPLGTIGTPKQVADLALYLAGEGASFLTGQVISPNGGFLI